MSQHYIMVVCFWPLTTHISTPNKVDSSTFPSCLERYGVSLSMMRILFFFQCTNCSMIRKHNQQEVIHSKVLDDTVNSHVR